MKQRRFEWDIISIDRRENPVSGPIYLPHHQAFARFAAVINGNAPNPKNRRTKQKPARMATLPKLLAFISEMSTETLSGTIPVVDVFHTVLKTIRVHKGSRYFLFWQIAHQSGVIMVSVVWGSTRLLPVYCVSN